jgi:hypothetical protein
MKLLECEVGLVKDVKRRSKFYSERVMSR